MRGLFLVGTIVALAALLPACSGSSSSASSDNGASNASTDSSNAASGDTSNSAASAAPATAATVAANGASANDGAAVFTTNCSSCHQSTGQGLPGAFPPLAGNPVVTGDAKTVIHIVKYGLNGKIQVAGHPYNGVMPAWGQNLSDAQIASVITFVRSSWGNHASAVSAADVAAAAK